MKNLTVNNFIYVTLITSIWINLSEVARYFLVVKPQMQAYLFEIKNVADMNLIIFMIWGVWDTLLTVLIVFICWLCIQVFGNNRKSIAISALISWSLFFVLFWVGMANMNLSSWSFLITVLPLAFLETLVASIIIATLLKKFSA